jgi:MoaA/NifB/PqqE/SkfB family radical SAM enzyme
MIKEIELDLTNYCPLNCDFCGINSTNNRGKSFFLKKYQIKNAILLAKKLECSTINFSGGEPLFNPNIFYAIQLAHKAGLRTVLFSNAYYAKKFINTCRITGKLKKSGLDKLEIALDVDHLKKIPYANILNAIKAALQYKIELELNIVDKKSTKNNNTIILNRLVKDLDAKIISNFFPSLTHLFLGKGIGISYGFIKIDRFIIKITRINLRFAQRITFPDSEVDFRKVEDILFDVPCPVPAIAIRWDGSVIGCPEFAVLNKKRFEIGHINHCNKINFTKYSTVRILDNFFNCIKLYYYLKESNNKKFLKLLNKKYINKCHFCSEVMDKINDKKAMQLNNYPWKYKFCLFLFKNFQKCFRYLINKIGNEFYFVIIPNLKTITIP